MKVIQLLLLAAVATSTVLGVTTPTSSNTTTIPTATTTSSNTTTIPTATTKTLIPTSATTASSTASSSSTDAALDITSSADIIATSDSALTSEADSLASSKEEDFEQKRPAKADSDSGPTGNGGGAIPPRSGAPLPESDAMIATIGSVATVVVAVGAYFL
ncbi:unnamed protein product [Peronospora destructor]|uniref:Uncharacterized protein n=1 Tax=Peronospora destructor TaxID=86335 RepID=A0AAV0TJ81_9STRA|nr:unnamed protein product [Peronospora destructor]